MKFSIKGEYQYVNPFKLKSTDPLIFATAGKLEGHLIWTFSTNERWFCRLLGASANRIRPTGVEHFATLELKIYASKNTSAMLGVLYISVTSKEVKQVDGELCILFNGVIIGGSGNCERAVGSFNATIVNGVVLEGEGNIILPPKRAV